MEAAINETKVVALKGTDLERIKQARGGAHQGVAQGRRGHVQGPGGGRERPGRYGAGGNPDGTAAAGDAAKGDVIDAEFKDLGDKK